MENHESANMQQEIIDSMAKKVTDLEKRQSKIEGLDLGVLPSKIEELESKVKETFDMRTLENTGQLARFDQQLHSFDEKVNAIPKSIPIKHKLEFDTRVKFVVRTMIGMGIAVALAIVITINLWLENRRMADETNKYLILRGFYPTVARSIDSAYVGNGDTLMKKARSNIVEQQIMLQAAIEAKQAADQSKQANEKLKKLKGKAKSRKKKTE